MQPNRLIHTFLALVVLTVPAQGLSADAKKTEIEELKARIEKLEKADASEKAGKEKDAFRPEGSGLAESVGDRIVKGFRMGAYGETKARYQDSPTGSKTGFDAHRLVILPSFAFTDRIIFQSEIEFEHGGAASSVDGDDKLFEGGNIEVEQVYVDFLINEYFNWRSLGIDLVPIGYINLFHEPTLFYSTERPELYRELIPSTWFEGSTSIFGKIVDGLNYQFQISTGLEDNSDTQTSGTYSPGITGTSGIRNSRPGVGGFNTSNNNFGYALRLSYQPSIIPGLAGSSSAYVTRTTPRQILGTFTVPGDSELAIFNTELRYRPPNLGIELRGEYVHILLGNNQNLLANRDGNVANNVGDEMFGYSLEASYHWNLNNLVDCNSCELVPFYRYSRVNLQTGDFRGLDTNAPTGQGDRQFHTFGLAFFPIPEVVLKLDYAVVLDESVFGPEANRLQGAVGFAF